MSMADAEVGATAARSRCFAFIFPMAAGHINPSLPVARRLVQLGHQVHYLCREQMRAAIQDTGATFHSDVEHEPELYNGREPGLIGAMEDFKKEHGMEGASIMVALAKLREPMVELMLPGVLRWLRRLEPSAVLFCPMLNHEAAIAAKILGIPRVPILTIAGPGSLAKTFAEFMKRENLTPDDMVEMRRSFKPLRECFGRLKAEYGVTLGLTTHYKPMGLSEAVRDSSFTLVTTTRALQDAVPTDLARAYEEAKTRFEFVGPLLDGEGACRAAGHRYHMEEEQQVDAAQQQDPVALVREARALGRSVVLVSMGTVITGDSADLGWAARLRASDGQPRGLTGGELCQAAWGGVFDAFGAETPEGGPLLVVALGPQANALGGLRAPANAFCAPVLPQVDLLKAGVDLFLTHGGQNSFTEALSLGTPLVVCPGFGDQFTNARKAVDLGVGLQVERPMPDEDQEAPAAASYRTEVAAAVRRVFGEQPFRSAAAECAEQLRVAGGVSRAVALILDVSTPPGPKNAGKVVAETDASKAVACTAGA